LVLKPLVGASSFGTYRISAAASDETSAAVNGHSGFFSVPYLHVDDPEVVKLRGGRLTEFPPEAPPRNARGAVEFASRFEFAWHVLRQHAFRYCLQPFVRTIETDGEFSLFMFDGRGSHAIRKVPRSGDFRVQEEYGATHSSVPLSDLSDALVDVAQRAVAHAPSMPLYARVDLVRLPSSLISMSLRGRGFVCGVPTHDQPARAADALCYAVMELELVEPSLYFNLCPAGVKSFVDAFRP